MITPPPGTRVWLAGGFTDMRNYAERTIMLSPQRLARYPRCSAMLNLSGRSYALSIILGSPGCRGGANGRTDNVERLSITHNLGGLGSATDWQNLESKESLVIPC